MSRIVSKLNLNKTPQLVENNSLVMAKNIRLLEDGTIGPDTSLEEIETKTGSRHETIVHHDQVVEENTINQYSILDMWAMIDYIIPENPITNSNFDDLCFDFYFYRPGIVSNGPSPQPIKFYRKEESEYCDTWCYQIVNGTPQWIRTRFRYNINSNALMDNNDCQLMIAIRYDIYDGSWVLPETVTEFYYVNSPSSTLGDTIVINKVEYVLANPVYYTQETETITYPAYDETIVTYDTPRYIGQIVGLDNKIYFFKEQLAVIYSPSVAALIAESYPNESFANPENRDQTAATFDVDEDGYVTRNSVLFENRDIAETLTPEFYDRIKIFEYNEVTNRFRRVNCNWHYSGGKINGCVTVNSSGEFILTIAEYDVPDDKLVPIKHINLNKSTIADDESFYTQAPNIPITNLLLDGRYVRNIPAGVYQFFIRYKVHDGFYTNWFPCSKELFAGSMKQTDTLQGSLKHIDLHEDSNYSFVFKIHHLFKQYCYKYEQYQLGFIISAEGGSFARSWKHFDMISEENSYIYFEYNKEDIEEINIDDLLKTTYDVFNVENITPYKNKLYISNYTETDFNEKLDSFAKQIGVKLKWKNINDETSDYFFKNLPLYESSITGIYDKFGAKNIKDTFGENNYCIIEDDPIAQTVDPEIVQTVFDGYDNFSIHDEYHDRITRVYVLYNNTRYYLHGSSLTPADITNVGWDTHAIFEYFIDDLRDNIVGIDLNGNYKININNTIIDISNINVEYTKYTIEPDSHIIEQNPQTGVYEEVQGWHIIPNLYKITRHITLKDLISSTAIFSEEYREYNSLLPFTKYDFYVHYIKQNGVVTNGYFICTKEIKRYCKGYALAPIHSAPYTELANTYNLDDMCFYDSSHEDYARYYNTAIDDYVYYRMVEDGLTDKTIIYPVFDNIRCPDGYVGCFISISKYGANVAQAFDVEEAGKAGTGYATRLDCLELDCLLYNTISNIKVYDSNGTRVSKDAVYYSSSTTNPVQHLGCSGMVEYHTDTQQNITRKLWLVFDSINKPYNKTLIKVTPYINLTRSTVTSYDNHEDVNTPGYFCEIKKLKRTYCNATTTGGLPNSSGYYVSGSDIYTRTIDNVNENDITLDEVDEHVDYNYSPFVFVLSNFNLNYVSLTEDLNPIVRRYNEDSSVEPHTTDKQFITVVDSLLCSFILELKSYFRDYIRKLYYEYTKNKITKFDNTIRVSSVDVDEIHRYIYKFEATDYYNIPSQRGIITNLFAIANGIYVHCEHSLFKFSDNKTINAQDEEVTLQENDVFNSGITEVFDAQYGYAGLKKREQSVITFNAYIFYDDIAKVIYSFGGEQQIAIISQPIQKLIYAINPIDITFVADEYHNRIFINFINAIGNVCLSFNFNSKGFISIHDMEYKFGFHSRRNTYFIHDNKQGDIVVGWSIYKIAEYILQNTRSDTPDPQHTEETLAKYYAAYQNCFKPSYIRILDCDSDILNEVNCVNSCVDVIVNTEYEKVKVINYLSWICSEIRQYGSRENIVGEELLDRLYPGTKLRIYSDNTETDLFELLDIYGNPKIANENRNIDLNGNPSPNSKNWKYPQYNCGVWSMNYFRDVRHSIINDANADIFEYTDDNNQITGHSGHSETTDLTPKITREYLTQENSLIYGKYFVVRFIFNNKNFKLENIKLQMNDYEKTK